MRKLFALSIMILLTTGCSTEENENSFITNPPQNDLRLVRMDMNYVDETTPYQILEYEYDASGRVDRVLSNSSDGTGETAISDYQYVDGRVVAIEYSNGTNRSYSYNGDLLVTSVQGTINYTYGYDSFGRLETITISSGIQEGCTTTFTYGNNSQPSESFNDCTGNTTVYTYDNKKNPQYYLFHASFSKIAPLTPNNISSVVVTGPTEEPNYTTDMFYNEEGWPTAILYSSEGNYVNSNRYYYQLP